MHPFRILTVLLAALALHASAADLAPHWHDEVFAPRLDALKQAANQLAQAGGEMCVHTSQSKLDATRNAWVATYAAWRALDPLPLDAAARLSVEPGPAELVSIESAIRAASTDAPAATLDPKASGLAAIEYLLWGNDRARAQLGRLAFHQRCYYTQTLATSVAVQVNALVAANESAAAPNEASYLGSAAQSLQQLRGTRLAHLGEDDSSNWRSPAPTDFDGWRSKQTKHAVAAEVATLEALLLGPDGSGGYLRNRLTGDAGAAQLAQLSEGFAAAHTALTKLPDDLSDALTRNPAAAAPLMAALRQLSAVVDALQAPANGG